MSEVIQPSFASAPPARVLVIDDEPQIRKFLEISLRAQGFAVELADTAQAGLAVQRDRERGEVLAGRRAGCHRRTACR